MAFGLLRRNKKTEIEKDLKIYDSLYDVSDVARGFNYWREQLYLKIARLFKWEGLPPTIPAVELEKILLRFGEAGVVNDSKFGFVAVPVHTFGVGLYPTYRPYAQWTTPLVKGSGIVNRDIIVIRNNSRLAGIDDIVSRYARMLADVESTLTNTLYNVRRPMMPAAPDEKTARSYMAADLSVRLGYTDAVINDSILDDVKMLEAIKTIPESIIDARAELLRAFLGEFGVAFARDKKAPMTTDEVKTDNQSLVIAIQDMRESRKESRTAFEYVLGLSGVFVDIDEAYKPIEESAPAAFNETGDARTGRGAE